MARHQWSGKLAAVAALLAGLALPGCPSDATKTLDAGACLPKSDCCHTNADCASQPHTFCLERTQMCVNLSKPCTGTAAVNPCCPGQTCGTTLGLCQDTALACATDADCNTAAGQYCDPTLGFFPEGPGCTFHTCTTNADCSTWPGLSCFNNACVGQPPCNGGCATGTVCVPAANTCFNPGTGANPSCLASCAPGSIMVFKTGTDVFDECDPAGLYPCECLALPNITTDDAARFSSAAGTGATLLVSAYDGEYGDLVLRSFSESTLTELPNSPVWIDGVPTTGPITGNPAGPRGGRSAPGPDVGRYTSIAYSASSSTTHISYYAVQDGTTPLNNLKYARQVGTAAWVLITVDGQDSSGNDTGDVGMYSSITLAPDGSPVIAYFQRSGIGTTAATTAVKVARAKSPTPMTAADWTISVVDTGTRALPPCYGLTCTSAQVCISQAGAPNGVCVTPAASTACTPACASSASCIAGSAGSSASCVTPLPALSTTVSLPDGNGLMPSIAYLDAVPVVVWYDHTNGQLKGVIATSDSAGQGASFSSTNIQLLDDGTSPANTGAADDVGRFASVAVGPSSAPHRLAVSYLDATTRQTLVLIANSDWSGATPQGSRVVDDGSKQTGTDTTLFVGANTSARFEGNLVTVIYQDSTGEKLRLATQAAPADPVKFSQVLTSTGAGGFYGSLVTDGASHYASHAVIAAKNATTAANQLTVLKLP